VDNGAEPTRSTVSVKNVLKVCFTVLGVAALVYFVISFVASQLVRQLQRRIAIIR